MVSGLRQPEVSIAMRYLRENDWVDMNDRALRKVIIGRITSYNVCYTKLLRKGTVRVRKYHNPDKNAHDAGEQFPSHVLPVYQQ